MKNAEHFSYFTVSYVGKRPKRKQRANVVKRTVSLTVAEISHQTETRGLRLHNSISSTASGALVVESDIGWGQEFIPIRTPHYKPHPTPSTLNFSRSAVFAFRVFLFYECKPTPCFTHVTISILLNDKPVQSQLQCHSRSITLESMDKEQHVHSAVLGVPPPQRCAGRTISVPIPTHSHDKNLFLFPFSPIPLFPIPIPITVMQFLEISKAKKCIIGHRQKSKHTLTGHIAIVSHSYFW